MAAFKLSQVNRDSNNQKKITIQELKECPEFAHIDDCLAQKMIDTIREFCIILAYHYEKQELDSENDILK
ncbi:MAG: hypothetical protein V4613_09460 [Bacteroidota bacterium]